GATGSAGRWGAGATGSGGGGGGAVVPHGSAAKFICPGGVTYGNPLTGMGSVNMITAPPSDYFAFIEGPIWIGRLSTLFFSDNVSLERIFNLLPPSTTPAVLATNSVSNGLGVDNSDRIIVADQAKKRIVRFDPTTGQEVMGTAVSTGNAKPNDLIV